MSLLEETADYGQVFKDCYDFVKEFRDRENMTDEESNEAQNLIYVLDLRYSMFASELYDKLKDITDWNDQNVVFFQMKTILPAVVFDNDLNNFDTKQALIKEWSNNPGGYYLIELIELLYKSLDWFNDDDTYKLRRFVNTYRKRQGANHDKKDSVSRTDTPKSLMNLSQNKCDYLFDMLTKDGYFMPADSNLNDFRYVFGGGICPNCFTPIKWKGRKRSLCELISMLLGTTTIPRPLQRDAGKLFLNAKNELIGELTNPKKNEPSNDCSTLETIVKTLKAHSL